MQVTNHSVSRQLNESHSRINPGDLTPVIVKDRLSAKEANVVIKGQEYKAEFQGSVPASDRMMAEVVGTPEKGKVILRQTEIPAKVNASASQTVENRMAQAGIDPAKNPDLKNAVRILEGKSVPLNKEQLLSLHKFVQEAPGTPEEKIESVRVVAQKNLPVTPNHLNSIHNALHGQNLKDALLNLIDGKQLDFEVPRPKVNTNTAGLIKEVRQSIQAEPNIQKAINHVKQQVLESPSFDAKAKQQVERAVTEANRLISTGQSGMAKGKLVQSLVTLENTASAEKAPAKVDGTNKPAELIQSISKTVERAVQQIKSGANPLNEIGEVLKSAERSSTNPQQLKQEIAKAQQIVDTARSQQASSETSKAEAIKEVRQAIQAEPNTQKAINHVKQQVLDNPDFDAKTKQQVEKAVTESNRLLSAGQPGLAKGHLVQSLVTLENNASTEKAMATKPDGSVTNKPAEQIQSITKAVERAVQQIKNGANPLNEIGEVLKSTERSTNNPQQLKQEIVKAQQVIETAAKQQPVSSETSKAEVIKEVRQAVQTEPSAQKAINHVKNQVLENPNFDAKTKQQVERAVTESNRLLSAGQPGMAKGNLVQSLVTLENNVSTEKAVSTKVDGSVPNKPAEPIQSISKAVERAVQQIKNGANPLNEIGEVLKSTERSSNNPQQLKQEIVKAQQVIETAKQQPVSTDTSKAEVIKEVRQAIQTEPNAQKAINHVKQQVLESPTFDAKTKQQVERAVTESNRLLSAGQPGMAKGNLVQSLVTLENNVSTEKAVSAKVDGSVPNKPAEPIQSISKTVERAVQQIKSGANPLNEMGEVLKSTERSTNNPQQLKQEIVKAQQVIETAKQQPASSETSKAEAIKEVRQAIQTEPNAQKAVNHVKQQVLESPTFDAKTKQQVERAVTEANRLVSANQPGMAKGQLVQSLVTLENSLEAEKAMTAKAGGSVTSKPAEPIQSISRTVEQAVQQIKSGANPANEIQKILSAVEKKNVENSPQLKQEIVKTRELLAAEKSPIDQGKHVNARANQEAEVIKQVRETVRAEVNQQKAIQHVKSQIVDSPDFDVKTKQQVERAIIESNKLLSAGQPGVAKENSVRSLAAIENSQAIDKVDGSKANPRINNVTAAKTAEPIQQQQRAAIELPVQQRNEAANTARATSSHQGNDNQQLSKTIEQTLHNLKNGADPVKAIDQVMKAVENKSAEGSQVLRKEIANAKTVLNELEGQKAIDIKPNENQIKSVSESSQTLSKSIEKALQQIKSGMNPAKQMETILPELDQQPDQKVQQLKAEVSKALQIQEAGRDRVLQAIEQFSGKDTLNKPVEKSSVTASKEGIQQGNAVKENVQKLQQEMAKATDMPADVKGKANQALSEGAKLHEIGTARLVESLKSLSSVIDGSQEVDSEQNSAKLQASLKEMLKEPSMPKLFDKVEEIVKEHSGNKEINFTDFKSSTEKAKQLNDQGRELAARKVVAEAVTQLEKDHAVLQNNAEQPALTESDKYAINETLQTLGLESKVMQVTEISKKLSQMAIDFKKVKQDITKNLDNISTMLDKKVNSAQVKQMLDTTINKLDNAILKSNFMLYTDMLTEKKMLKASSQLSEARSLMAKGELTKANEIVKEVKTVLDRIIFKPSTTRVQNLVSEQSLMKQPVSTEEQLAYGIKQAVRPMPDQDYSSRQVFESLKRLGLTHENDAANSLVFGSKGEGEELNNNLKSALIKMVSDGEGQAKAEQALSNLTGQQLLNKQDSSGMQNLFFQMPFLLDQKMENIKVFINSQKSGEKIDWENCNLYFVLETKKLGEIGVLVSAQNKNLSITFNSNKENLQQTLGPLTEISAERLQEIGYRLEAIKVKKPSETNQEGTSAEMKSQTLTPAFTEKGYDFSI